MTTIKSASELVPGDVLVIRRRDGSNPIKVTFDGKIKFPENATFEVAEAA